MTLRDTNAPAGRSIELVDTRYSAALQAASTSIADVVRCIWAFEPVCCVLACESNQTAFSLGHVYLMILFSYVLIFNGMLSMCVSSPPHFR